MTSILGKIQSDENSLNIPGNRESIMNSYLQIDNRSQKILQILNTKEKRQNKAKSQNTSIHQRELRTLKPISQYQLGTRLLSLNHISQSMSHLPPISINDAQNREGTSVEKSPNKQQRTVQNHSAMKNRSPYQSPLKQSSSNIFLKDMSINEIILDLNDVDQKMSQKNSLTQMRLPSIMVVNQKKQTMMLSPDNESLLLDRDSIPQFQESSPIFGSNQVFLRDSHMLRQSSLLKENERYLMKNMPQKKYSGKEVGKRSISKDLNTNNRFSDILDVMKINSPSPVHKQIKLFDVLPFQSKNNRDLKNLIEEPQTEDTKKNTQRNQNQNATLQTESSAVSINLKQSEQSNSMAQKYFDNSKNQQNSADSQDQYDMNRFTQPQEVATNFKKISVINGDKMNLFGHTKVFEKAKIPIHSLESRIQSQIYQRHPNKFLQILQSVDNETNLKYKLLVENSDSYVQNPYI